MESDDGETGNVVLGRVFGSGGGGFGVRVVNGGDAGVPAGSFEGGGESARVKEAVRHDGAVAGLAEAEEVEVLADNVGGGAGELEKMGNISITSSIVLGET